MAIFASSIITDEIAVVKSIRDFAEANGYTIDLHEQRRLHIHKYSGEYFGFYGLKSFLYIYGHTGFDSSLPTHTQPGTSPETYGYINTGVILELYATANAIYMGLVVANRSEASGGVGRMVDKLGTWTGGQFVSPPYSSIGRILGSPTGRSDSVCSLRKDGVWTPKGYGTGTLQSTDADATFCNKMPFSYSAGVAPSKILVMVRGDNPDLFIPIGYAPDVYKIRFGDVYAAGERISIGGASYQVAGMFKAYAFKVP